MFYTDFSFKWGIPKRLFNILTLRKRKGKTLKLGHITQLTVQWRYVFASASKWKKAIFWYIQHNKKIYHASVGFYKQTWQLTVKMWAITSLALSLSNISDFSEKQTASLGQTPPVGFIHLVCFPCSRQFFRTSGLVLKQPGQEYQLSVSADESNEILSFVLWVNTRACTCCLSSFCAQFKVLSHKTLLKEIPSRFQKFFSFKKKEPLTHFPIINSLDHKPKCKAI